MKLVTFENPPGRLGVGVLNAEQDIIDLSAAEALASGSVRAEFTDMIAFIEGGDAALERARALVRDAPRETILPKASTPLRAPLPRPTQIRDFLCFEQHLKQGFERAIEVRAALSADPQATRAQMRATGRWNIPEIWYRQPIYYKANRMAVSGPEDAIHWPPASTLIDFELELAAVVGRRGVDIPKADARKYLFGLTIFNDFSARDLPFPEIEGMLGPAKGKDFDGANALGPCIVTLDEIGDPYDLAMSVRVNGSEWARGHTSSMGWRWEDLVEHVSRSETIYPGEVFGSGTVGNGCGVELGRFLSDGDVVELEIEKIGVLRNRIVR